MISVATWMILGTTSLLSLIYYLKTSFARNRRPKEPDVVKGSLIWGSAVDFNTNAVDFLQKSRAQHGNCFTIRLINQYLTIIMDPHSYEAMSKEKNFDFDPIQKQVNLNVFNFVLKDPVQMTKNTAKTVRGPSLNKMMHNFVKVLNRSCAKLDQNNNSIIPSDSEWSTEGLRSFTSKTMFNAIFNNVFGDSDSHAFNAHMAHKNFDIFHHYFNYFWLGLPKKFFPKAMAALTDMLVMPSSDELLGRDDLSDYLRSAINYMKEQGQTESDIWGHNLVYLHVNYNTFRLAFWALNNILEDKRAYEALMEEINNLVESHIDPETNTATISMKEVENLKVLDSVMNETMRLASGVFMVRHIIKDTMFTTSDGKEQLFREGDRVAIYPPAIHKDPSIYENPLEFEYDRFIDTTFYKDGKPIKNPIMAFGSLCPGKRYATLQLKWYVIKILTQFNMHLQDGEHAEYAYEYHGHEVLPPKKDVHIDFQSREHYPVLEFLHEYE